MTRVKVCCIENMYEAQMAIEAGAAALGLVGHMPSGPGVIPDAQILTIARHISPPIASFLLTSETRASDIIAHYRKAYTSTIQLVDALTEDLRAALPAVKLVQVIHMVGDTTLQQAAYVAPYVDAILLDSGNPHLATKQLGGTGRTHNWQVSCDIVQNVPVPVFLAGGLTPDNVQLAIETVRPFGIDVCTGLRSQERLDPVKLRAFMQAVQAADAALLAEREPR
jgi:phosphoribosylanthranilate isomerase